MGFGIVYGMNTVIHRAHERGVSELGWLSSRFSFSFADWYNPERMGFGALRVINDDTIAPNSGFGRHPHRDMEIITMVMSGTVTHEDSEGNRGSVSSGEVQVLSAGVGVFHSEYNNSPTEELKLFQIWISPNITGATVHYAQKNFDYIHAVETELPLVTPFGKATNGELMINQNAWITRVRLTDESFEYHLKQKENGAYIFVVTGNCSVAGNALSEKDAIGVWDTTVVVVSGEAVLLIIDVPMHA